jgi:hypothetical protein
MNRSRHPALWSPLPRTCGTRVSKLLTAAAKTVISLRRWLKNSVHDQSEKGTPALNLIDEGEQQFRLFRSEGADSIIYCVTDRATELPHDPFQAARSPNRGLPGRRIYIASKVTHASRWLDLRNAGWPIISTWIDEAGEGESKSLADLTLRCIAEASSCTHFVLYSEHGEILKGALLECGAALAHDIPVYCVGSGPSISRVFENHPCWHTCDSVEDALYSATTDYAGPRATAPFNFEARFTLACSTEPVESKT